MTCGMVPSESKRPGYSWFAWLNLIADWRLRQIHRRLRMASEATRTLTTGFAQSPNRNGKHISLESGFRDWIAGGYKSRLIARQ